MSYSERSFIEVILTRGLSGCGKTFWTKKTMEENPGKYKRVNKDTLREMLDCNVWNPRNECFLNRIMDLIIMEAVKSGKNVINDDTNLNPVHENRIREMLKDKPWVTVKIQNFMDIPIETCIERDNQRLGSHCIGEKAIREQLKRFERDKKKVEGSISI